MAASQEWKACGLDCRRRGSVRRRPSGRALDVLQDEATKAESVSGLPILATLSVRKEFTPSQLSSHRLEHYEFTGNTIFITRRRIGAFGRALAEALHKRGNKVISRVGARAIWMPS